jgi:hypothetical protein
MPPRRSPRPPRDIIEFVTGDDFLGDKSLSVAQIAILKAFYGLKMTGEEMAAFLAMHEGKAPRAGGYDEMSLGCGRRGGKGEKIGAPIVAYECLMFNPKHLAPGETAYGIDIAQNEKQARIDRDYVEAKFAILEDKGWKVFEERSAQSKAVTAEEIRLANRVIVKCMPCKKVSTRGLTTIVINLQEIGHFQLEEGAYNADVEIIRAVRPTRATMKSRGYRVPLIKASTPYDEIGVFHDDWKRRHQTRQLVMHEIPTRFMNPTISMEFLEQERIADPDSFEREYLAKWGSATQGKLFTRELVDSCTVKALVAEPPIAGERYIAHIDAAFKSDFFPLCIGRLDGTDVVQSYLGIWKPQPERPLDDDVVASEMAPVLIAYGQDTVIGDQFCGVPLAKAFANEGITFIERPVNEENKFKEYKNLLSVMTARRLRLLDIEEIARDLLGLRRKGKRISAPHRRNAHDDVSSVLRRVVFDLLPMINRADLESLNQGAMRQTKDALMRERGFTVPEREGDLPRAFMSRVF